MTVFDDIETAMGNLLGSQALGGWVLGIIIVLLLFLPIVFLRRGAGAATMAVMAVVLGIAFDVGVGWWDPWTIVFIVVVAAILLVRPFVEDSGGGA